MAYETILYEKKDRMAFITLNRPRILNAYNDTMGDELLDAHQNFDQDDALHVLIISGAGRAFCSGADVKQRQLRPVEELKRLGGPAGSPRPAGGLLGIGHTVNWKPSGNERSPCKTSVGSCSAGTRRSPVRGIPPS